MKNVPVGHPLRSGSFATCFTSVQSLSLESNWHAAFKALGTSTSFEVTAESENLYLSHL